MSNVRAIRGTSREPWRVSRLAGEGVGEAAGLGVAVGRGVDFGVAVRTGVGRGVAIVVGVGEGVREGATVGVGNSPVVGVATAVGFGVGTEIGLLEAAADGVDSGADDGDAGGASEHPVTANTSERNRQATARCIRTTHVTVRVRRSRWNGYRQPTTLPIDPTCTVRDLRPPGPSRIAVSANSLSPQLPLISHAQRILIRPLTLKASALFRLASSGETHGVQELDQSARRSGRWLSIARHGAPRSRGPRCSGRASSRRRWADLWRIVRDPRGEGVRRDPDLLERVVGDPHLLHRPLSLRCVIDGRRGGLASTISTQPARWESTARRRPPRGAVGRRPPCRRAAARSHPSRGS